MPYARRKIVAVAIGMLLPLAAEAPAADARGNFVISARTRDAGPDGGEAVVRERTLEWNPRKSAVVICDMWDKHWCRGATERVAAMAPRMSEVVRAARQAGALVIHCPSGCVEFYADTPQRRRAQQAPRAADLPDGIQDWCSRLEGEPPLPIDDADGGCDCDPQCEHSGPWTRQIAAIEIAEDDAISDSGVEVWNLLAERGVENVVVMGVHTNMCVAGRPFALRQLARNGKNVVLARDLTDSMYNHRRAPYVEHRRGTELVVAHLEQYVCPSVDSADITGDAAAPHVVFMIGEDEYETAKTLPRFAERTLAPRGVRTTFVHARDAAPNDFAGIEQALADADLLVLSVRRRTPSAAQLAAVRRYLESGKPLVGIRTASHAFDAEPPAGCQRWSGFDVEVLGAHYQGHYSNKPPHDPQSEIWTADGAATHPILNGGPSKYVSTSHLYKNRDLADSARLLEAGRVQGQDMQEAVTWTNSYRGGRVFYTALGSPADFASPAFCDMLVRSMYWALERDVPQLAAVAAPPTASGAKGD